MLNLRSVGCVAIIALSCLCGAQTPLKEPRFNPDTPRSVPKDRVSLIWLYAGNRLSRQSDVFFDLGDFPAAIQVLKVSAELYPADYDGITNLGWMLENVENYPEAEKVYRQYLKMNPNDPDRGLALADFLFRTHKYALIPPLLEPILQVEPNSHANNYRHLAHAYEKMKKYQDAVRVWKAYLAKTPKDLTAKANLARVEHKIAAQG